MRLLRRSCGHYSSVPDLPSFSQAVAESAQQQAQRTALAEQQLAVMREELATVGQRQVSTPRQLSILISNSEQ